RGRYTPVEAIGTPALLHCPNAVAGHRADRHESDRRVRGGQSGSLPGRRHVAPFTVSITEEHLPLAETAGAGHLFASDTRRTSGHAPGQAPGLGERRGLSPPHERRLDLDAFLRLDHHEPRSVRYETAKAAEERRQIHLHLPSGRAPDQRLAPGPLEADVDIVEKQPSGRRADGSRIELE